MWLVLLVSLLLLWVAFAACFAVAWAIRPQPGKPDAKWPKWTLPVAGFAFVIMLVAIPAAAIYFSAVEKPAQGRGGVTLTASEQRGKQVFNKTCKRCHTLADSKSYSTIGPNFDALPPARATVIDAVLKGRARGNGQMPKRLVDEESAQDVADYLEHIAGR